MLMGSTRLARVSTVIFRCTRCRATVKNRPLPRARSVETATKRDLYQFFLDAVVAYSCSEIEGHPIGAGDCFFAGSEPKIGSLRSDVAPV